ncbi:hypothetical protein AZI85_16065 [Bdellovibrio bacteriovorus]|uniref:O-antigen ligase-related domain-containing protein n=1 Tax=Bdellovibrio bacteriovorus TaxID=959 RepID=A0A150WTP9_BDEBC|nr:O-antigen ligase family protein [Bdellovibrio bacteriovorus]KYG69908.1 hypothetical protein AZI85_16065 [Bdellovibrio bacteriovorus]
MSKIANILLHVLIFVTIIHWRAFDAMIVLSLLILIAGRPFSIDQIAGALKQTKLFHFLIVAWLLVVFIGNYLYGTPAEVLNFRWIFGSYIIYAVSRLNRVKDDSFLSTTSLVVTAGAILAFVYAYQSTTSWPSQDNRFSGFYHNPNVYGMTLSLPCVYLIGWVLTAIFFKKKISTWNILALGTLTATVFFTYSRSSWMGLVSATLMAVFVMRKNRTVILGFIFSILVGIIMFLTNFMSLKERLLYTGDFTGATSTTVRIEIWKANIAMFLDQPWFGVGYWHNTELLSKYTTPDKVPGDDIFAHAHNQYLQVLSGTGIIGFTIYLLLIAVIGFYFWGKYQSSKDVLVKRIALCAFLSFVSYLFTSLSDSPLDSRETRDFFMIILAGSLGIIHNRTQPATINS